MAHRTLLTKILLPFLAIILIALIGAAWEATTSMRRFHRQEIAASLEVRAREFQHQLSGKFDKKFAPEVDAFCKDWGALSETRLTVILPAGEVIGDTEEIPARMDNHADRPEVKEALAGRVGAAIRYSHTLHSDRIYVALPVYESGALACVMRTSASLESVDRALGEVYARIALGSAIAALLAALVSAALARKYARPLREMVKGTARFARGQFDQRLAVPDSMELAELATGLNSMALQLHDRIQTVHRQRNELDAVLSSMTEGVVAVDGAERIISLNRAASHLFGVTPEAARGRDLREVIRNPRLQEIVKRMLASHEPFEDEIVLGGAVERHLLASLSGLRDESGREMGALLVLQDVTELRRLERARSDFVANVSHEIRTPVTSIKGYAETLLNESNTDPETLTRFLEIIARQADRLSALVDDILSLAALERSEAAKDVPFERVGLQGLIEAAVHVCTPQATVKNTAIAANCEADLAVMGNSTLLEQALVNLLDNAVKYSNPDSTVTIEANRAGQDAQIRVRDFGQGIASDHLPRIFERFYRVDRARSRTLGGTGPGLAIVKHIVSLHDGRITVESALGKGSCFTIHLPAADWAEGRPRR
ncbi:MAG: PAS domain-containing protein [Candidatus Hydrogenedentes bacterium]|nr:PAS domain-containing protein [Candidatus Hydrogenedentota bacterium]